MRLATWVVCGYELVCDGVGGFGGLHEACVVDVYGRVTGTLNLALRRHPHTVSPEKSRNWIGGHGPARLARRVLVAPGARRREAPHAQAAHCPAAPAVTQYDGKVRCAQAISGVLWAIGDGFDIGGGVEAGRGAGCGSFDPDRALVVCGGRERGVAALPTVTDGVKFAAGFAPLQVRDRGRAAG